MPPQRTLRRPRPVRAIVVGLVASIVVVAWMGNEPSTTAPISPPADAHLFVRYEITAPEPGASARITYQTSCGDTITAARTPLPWSMALSVRPGSLAGATAELDGEGAIDAQLLVNGVLAEADSAHGPAAAVEVSLTP